MSYDETFFDNFYNLKLKHRLEFFLLIWYYGKFHSEILNELDLTRKESVIEYAKMIHKMGFLSIEQKHNSSNYQDENFYFISDDNFNNIFVHICNKSGVAFNPDAYQLAFRDRANIHPLMEEKIDTKLDFDESFSKKELFAILNKNLAFFFLFIMRISLTIKQNEYFDAITNALTKESSLDADALYDNVFRYIFIPSMMFM